MAIKTGKELATACENVAKNYKTLYVLGCFGWPLTKASKDRAKKGQQYNRNIAEKLDAATADTFGFDCVCLIKALLWGWKGDASKSYGGAVYGSNGVPDIGTEQMIAVCSGVTTDFSNIQVGELLWMKGHVGVYIGGGLAVECTPSWKDKVQITAVLNIGKKSGYNGRKWTKHGKLPYVTYDAETVETKTKEECTVNLPVLKKGAKGESVKSMQQLLLAKGYKMENNGKTYGADGSFGGATVNGIKSYQKANGLPQTGECDAKTWSKLLGV